MVAQYYCKIEVPTIPNYCKNSFDPIIQVDYTAVIIIFQKYEKILKLSHDSGSELHQHIEYSCRTKQLSPDKHKSHPKK